MQKNEKCHEEELNRKLESFAVKHGISGKGPLSVVLIITDTVTRKPNFPLSPKDYLTPSGGQVSGASGAAVQRILKKHGIIRTLSAEGGRTSRGSIQNMTSYVEFLNALNEQDLLQMDIIEQFWVQKVKQFFASQPLKLKLDKSKSLKRAIADLLDDAFQRQKEMSGFMLAGAVLQHLVGAKLSLALPEQKIKHHGFSVADTQTGRVGDFLIGDTAIHVTTAPTEKLLHKCRENIDSNLRPLIITTRNGAGGIEALAENAGMVDRIEVLEVDQFLMTNVFEWSDFADSAQHRNLKELTERYNSIVTECETDPSLRIEMG